MNKIDCNVIQDLIPLYVDDAASPETKDLVESHVASCADCQTELETMQKALTLPLCSDLEEEKAGVISAIQKQFQRKKVRAAILSALISAVLIIGVYVIMVFPSRVIPYEEGLISVRDDDGDVWLHFNGKSYDCFYGREILEVEIDGKKKNAKVIYYDETLYSRYLEPLLRGENLYGDEILLNDPYYTQNDDGEMERVEQELDVVYYSSIKLNSHEMAERDWTDHIDDMEIIWERDTL